MRILLRACASRTTLTTMERDVARGAVESGDPSRRVVAVTGSRTYLGRELIRRLDGDPRYHSVVAVDIEEPSIDGDSIVFERLDLTAPTAATQLAEILEKRRVDTVVHGAFLTFPSHASAWAHELEDVGTMHVLDACAASKPERFVLLSSTLMYGARRKNPSFISPNTPLEDVGTGYIGDKVRADLQTGRFADEHPDIAVCRLRFAPLLGPTVDGLFPRFFQSPFAPVLLGRDPLMQMVHEHDALLALKRAVDCEEPIVGPINIVGRGVLPYTTLIALMGKVPLPIPRVLAKAVAQAAWTTQLAKTPPVLLDFLQYLCVADGSRAQRELGFRAEYNQREIALDYLGVVGEDGGVDLTRVGAT